MPNTMDFAQLDHVANPVFVLEVAPDGRPLYVAFNANARAATGRPLSDYLGKTACEIYGNALGQVAYDHHCTVAKTGKSLTYEIELPFEDGLRLVRTTLNPAQENNGDITLIYGSSVDLSADKKARETQVSLDTLTSEMEQFVAMAAHDLRAPMRNVAVLADMLRDEFVDHGDGKVELIDMLEDMAARSLALITDVLSHAHVTSIRGKVALFEFDALCQDIFSVLDPQGTHTLVASKAVLHADRTVLQILVRNLIENALKHGSADAMTVTVSLREVAPNWVEVVISDTGSGFDNPGIQFLDNGVFKAESGYGLLGIRRLINARGGQIKATNTKDGGGRVTFTLPGTLQGCSIPPKRKIRSAAAR